MTHIEFPSFFGKNNPHNCLFSITRYGGKTKGGYTNMFEFNFIHTNTMSGFYSFISDYGDQRRFNF